jgi:hypothetical protein
MHISLASPDEPDFEPEPFPCITSGLVFITSVAYKKLIPVARKKHQNIPNQ